MKVWKPEGWREKHEKGKVYIKNSEQISVTTHSKVAKTISSLLRECSYVDGSKTMS